METQLSFVRTRPHPVRESVVLPHAALAWPEGVECTSTLDRDFVRMLNGYRASGGLMRVRDVVEQFRQHQGPDVATLATWLTGREIIGIDWRGHTWLPMFQFDPVRLTPLPTLAPAFSALIPMFDAWELADWFARPSNWLAGRVPAEVMKTSPQAVAQAARADQVIAGA